MAFEDVMPDGAPREYVAAARVVVQFIEGVTATALGTTAVLAGESDYM
jgi:hypothetical protein